jgi:DNA-binding response OmpR family regulator
MARILIVDDSEVVRAKLSEILSREHELLTAIDGESAVSIAVGEEKPELILLDVHLPGTDGYEVCRSLKSFPETAHVPVIFITSLASERERVRGFEAGAEDYIVKPFYPEELLARVRLHLDLRKAKEQAVELEKLKLLQEVAVSLSHQIYNPMTAVFGCLGVLEAETGELNETARYSVAGIREGLERIRTIVDRLSRASRIPRVAYDENQMIDFSTK